MHGIIERDRDNISLKLGEWLKEDKAQRRFSMISFDSDRPQARKAVSRQVSEGNLVGYVAFQRPDFEFHNFNIDELAEVAARIDEANGVSGDPIRNADWSGIETGKSFEEKYCRASARKPRSLKGEDWGRALARYAWDNPKRKDNGRKRPLMEEIEIALQARNSDYDFHAARGEIDPITFKLSWRLT